MHSVACRCGSAAAPVDVFATATTSLPSALPSMLVALAHADCTCTAAAAAASCGACTHSEQEGTTANGRHTLRLLLLAPAARV